MEYMTTAEAAKQWGISTRRVTTLCNEGRVKGAVVMGRTWIIPRTATKPEEQRRGRKSN